MKNKEQLIEKLTNMTLRCLPEPKPYILSYLKAEVAKLVDEFPPPVLERIAKKGLPDDPAVVSRGAGGRDGGLLVVDPNFKLDPGKVPTRHDFIKAALGRTLKRHKKAIE